MQVRVVPNFKHPRMSSARIVIANETVPIGSRANEGIETIFHSQRSSFSSSGFEVEGYDTQLMSISPDFQAVGQFLIIQRDQSVGGRNAALSAIEVIAYCPGSDVPNSPEKPSEGDLDPGTPGFPHCTDFFTQGTQPAPEAKPLSLIQSQCRAARGKNLGKTSAQMGTKRPFARPRVSPTPP